MEESARDILRSGPCKVTSTQVTVTVVTCKARTAYIISEIKKNMATKKTGISGEKVIKYVLFARDGVRMISLVNPE